MKHKAWCAIEEVTYCSSRSYVKFYGHTGREIDDFESNERFPTVTLVWLHKWLRNDAQSIEDPLWNFKVTRAENGRFVSELSISVR